MGETLDALQRLQAVELKLAAIRRKREAKQRRIDVHKRKLQEIDQRLQENEKRKRDIQVQIDALNLDVAAKEDKVRKHREALNSAKTNKEYSSILAAMNTEKADAAKVESRIIELLDQIQKFDDAASQIDAERAALADKLKQAEAALAESDQASSEDRARLQSQRDAVSEGIGPGVLACFERVADRHDGEALASVTKIHPKRDEYICEGCNLKVTLEVINSLQTRDDIQLCPVCGRILYLETIPT